MNKPDVPSGPSLSLAAQAHAVESREDLLRFLARFVAEGHSTKAEWAHQDLLPFLEAMSAWAEDAEGYYENRGEDPERVSPWRVFADMLMAARHYE